MSRNDPTIDILCLVGSVIATGSLGRYLPRCLVDAKGHRHGLWAGTELELAEEDLWAWLPTDRLAIKCGPVVSERMGEACLQVHGGFPNMIRQPPPHPPIPIKMNILCVCVSVRVWQTHHFRQFQLFDVY